MLRTDRTQFASNGERIYFTATSDSGDVIDYEGGPGGGMMAGSLACVSCHGPDGRGGRVTLMMRTFDAPDITWPVLTAAHGAGAEHEADAEMEHPPYTEATLGRAITQGLDPAGKPLDPLMPRWRLSDRDLADLVAYLMTLGVEATPIAPTGSPTP
jgi:mono/diheme cytochrome c family protein